MLLSDYKTVLFLKIGQCLVFIEIHVDLLLFKKNQKEDQKVQKKYEIWIRSILDK